MKSLVKLILSISIVLLLIGATIPPALSTNTCAATEELVLLRGEYVFILNASADVDAFTVQYSFPPPYLYQVPILFELLNDTTATILDYAIENDTNTPNRILNFTIAPMIEDESVKLHFYYWVLVKNHEYDDLPDNEPIPQIADLPEETKPWLVSTEVVQTNSILLQLKARQLKGLNNNLRALAFKIAKFTKYHRYLFFLFQYRFGTYKSQDALTTLLRNGECPGRSHLGCALFRANNVPARVILATPHYDFWYQIHFMTEYYFPEYGWILTEVHKGETPFEPKHQIIMRICYPEDENDTDTAVFFPQMTGLERYFWIKNEQVTPYFKDFNEGSKSNMFSEKTILTDPLTAKEAFERSKEMFNQYQYVTGENLTGVDLAHFNNATWYQKQAVIAFKNSNVDGYYNYITLALDEYTNISV